MSSSTLPSSPWEAALASAVAESPHNLVSRNERERVAVHIDEAKHLAQLISPRPCGQWMDLGTGGGLPGLVLAHEHPEVSWVLVDAVAKKLGEVERFAALLGLGNTTVLHGRAENLARHPGLRGGFGGVVARAVAKLPVLAELARGFLSPGGVLVAVKGPGAQAEVGQSQAALRMLGLQLVGFDALDAALRPTVVVTMRAVGQPPARYPRAVGVARRTPLGADR